MNNDPNRIYIFDTTLRDGEQSPGASLDERGKLEIAKQLAELRVDIIEACVNDRTSPERPAPEEIGRAAQIEVVVGTQHHGVASQTERWARP